MSSAKMTASGLALAAVLSGTACSTEEIGNYGAPVADGTQAPFTLSLAPDADTFEETQGVTGPAYGLRVDGVWATWDAGTKDARLVQLGGGTTIGTSGGAAWSAAGPHVFELVDGSGHTVLKTPPYELKASQANHLVVFGHADALEHRFFTSSFDVPAGTQRFTLLNLLRTGERLDALRCDDPNDLAGCETIVSGIGYGAVVQGDAPAAASANLYYRLLPVAGAPGSAMYPLSGDPLTSWPDNRLAEGTALPRISIAAPVIASPAGDVLQSMF